MEYLVLGFFTGLSLILAIGAQNIFVIEQGLKKQYIFLVCIICSISDLLLIFLGLFLFHYFNQYFNSTVELIFNILLIIFLIHFIYSKINERIEKINFNKKIEIKSLKKIIFKTLGFTYLNPHVYSDTVFFLGNFSKNFLIYERIKFGIGASLASLLFFFSIGYMSSHLSKYVQRQNAWNIINNFIIIYMSLITFFVFVETIKLI